MRVLPFLAFVSALAVAPTGCVIVSDDGHNCTTDLRNYGITLKRNAPMVLADVAQIAACIDGVCAYTGPADGTGARNFGDPTNGDMPRGQVTLTDAGGGNVQVVGIFQMNERTSGYNSLSVRLTSKTGATQIVTGTVSWYSDGCHGNPQSTIAAP